MKHYILAMAAILMLATSARAQINGKVFDAINRIALENVHVIHKGNVIAVTNASGKYRLQDAEDIDSLKFQRIGYKSRIITVDKHVMQIPLSPKPTALKGVAVKGYNWPGNTFSRSGPVSVLNKRDIERIAISGPPDLLNMVSGIYAHSGARNTNRITIRGIGARSMYSTTKIKAYLNEIPLTSGMGETTLEDLDLDLIDRLTVIKGPSSTTYGAPLGGVINMRISGQQQQGSFIQTKNTIGSFGLMKNSLRAMTSGDNTSAEIAYTHLVSDGFRENDNYNRDALTAIVHHRLNNDLDFTYFERYHKLKAYIPSSLDEQTYRNNPQRAAQNWQSVKGHEDYHKFFSGLSMQWDVNNKVTNTTGLFYKDYAGYERRPFNVLDDNTATLGARTLFKTPATIATRKFYFRVGYEFFYDDYDWNIFETIDQKRHGDLLSKNTQHRYYHNAFITGETSWKTFTFSAGLNYNKTHYRYLDHFNDSIDYSTAHAFEGVVSPRLSISYDFTGNIMAYGNISHGFSAPSYEEAIDSEGFANTGLQPETGWNREIGFRAQLLNNKFTASASLFSINIDDLLVTKRLAEDRYTKINAGETRHNGLEFTLNAKPVNERNFKSTFKLSYTHSAYRFIDFTDEGNDYDGNFLPGIPKNKLFVSGDVEIMQWAFIHANWLWVDEMPMNDANSLYASSYGRLSLKGGLKKNVFKKWMIKVYGGINNLTDNHYPSMVLVNAVGYGGSDPRYYYPAPPRNFYAGIAISYFF
ncbi:MAG: TonB-dependent receptor [Bacteroidales bacterium]|nr:TonB-dependent receptor [Bacteroidales bacterium]